MIIRAMLNNRHNGIRVVVFDMKKQTLQMNEFFSKLIDKAHFINLNIVIA